MPARSVSHYRVLYDQCGPGGRARSSTLLRYFQEAGFRHSHEGGFPYAWYVEHNVAWVARESVLHVARAPEYDETVTVDTWVESFGRSRARRAYDARDGADRRLARGYTDWVFVDTSSGRPALIPDDVRTAFPTADGDETWPAPPEFGEPPTRGTRAARVVQVYDLDPMAHVNNATYLDYVGHALAEGLAGARKAPGLQALRPVAHRVEYQAAVAAFAKLDVLTVLERESPIWRQQSWATNGERAVFRAASIWREE